MSEHIFTLTPRDRKSFYGKMKVIMPELGEKSAWTKMKVEG